MSDFDSQLNLTSADIRSIVIQYKTSSHNMGYSQLAKDFRTTESHIKFIINKFDSWSERIAETLTNISRID